jgi:alkylation response protein AidB-like acyl-CoA dehydrogenase
MSKFRVDTRDLKFNLYEYLNLEAVLNKGPFEGIDRDLVDAMLEEAERLAVNVLAPTNEPADRVGVKLVDGVPRVPEVYHGAYKAFCENGWMSLCHPMEWEGMGMPRVVGTAADEMFIGAAGALNNYVGLSRAAVNLLLEVANEEQQKAWIPKLMTGEWQGTMCLTEAGAGSDVGASTTIATPNGDGTYNIKGTKIFITSGDHDMVENVVHIVLARLPDAPVGSRGLSLFVVPKTRLDGTFNDVHVASIEHKMGINASATCVMNFGDEDGCVGEMLGGPGQGLAGMFHMMNEERIIVGQQGQALAAAAYFAALEYANERIQGSDIGAGKSTRGDKVAIVAHPDVRRMLMTTRAWVEAGRAMLLDTAFLLDRARAEEDATERGRLEGRLALMTPICKAWGSETGFLGCSQAMQVFGGYGYTQDYPAEQYVRDARIASVYEGTNGIQAIDLLFRKATMQGGALVKEQLGEIGAWVEANGGHASLGVLVQQVGRAAGELGKVSGHLAGLMQAGDMRQAALGATPYLTMFGNLIGAYHLVRQALMADAALAERGVPAGEGRAAALAASDENRFYDSKLKTAAFFVHQLLPENRMRAAQILSDDSSALEIAF